MAVAPVAELAIFSPDGEGDSPAGVPMDVGRMKSSRFMVSLFAMIVGGCEFRVWI